MVIKEMKLKGEYSFFSGTSRKKPVNVLGFLFLIIKTTYLSHLKTKNGQMHFLALWLDIIEDPLLFEETASCSHTSSRFLIWCRT